MKSHGETIDGHGNHIGSHFEIKLTMLRPEFLKAETHERKNGDTRSGIREDGSQNLDPGLVFLSARVHRPGHCPVLSGRSTGRNKTHKATRFLCMVHNIMKHRVVRRKGTP